VLMGRLSPLDGVGPRDIGLDRLQARVAGGEVREVILATNFTNEGEATAHYIAEMLRSRELRVSRIARGVPLGGELEYVDAGTISQALLERREIEVTTLDALRAERGWKGPFGLKIDAEGYEHQVIEGAAALLQETEFVIAEVSITRPFTGGASFADFIALMDGHGFSVHDLLDGLKRGNGGVEFVDVMFRRG